MTSTLLDPWPIQADHLFKYLPKKSNEDQTVYKIDLERLLANQCHIFCQNFMCEEWIVARALEVHSFSSSYELSKNFHIDTAQVGPIDLTWLRFPIEFKETCKQIAKLFDIMMTEKRTDLVCPYQKLLETKDRTLVLQFPLSENLLFLDGERTNDEQALSDKYNSVLEVFKRFR